MKRKLGFIGLGAMGQPMAANLLKAGYPLTVHNRTSEKARPLQAEGASVAASPKEVAAASEVTMTVAADDAAVEAIYLGPDGVLAGARSGSIVIDSSTVSPSTSRRVAGAAAAHGVKMLDAPVLGSVKPAQERLLKFIVGGDREVYEQSRDIFEALGQQSTHVGPSGAGCAMKLVLNLVLGISMQAIAEAVALATRAGLDRQQMLELLAASTAGSPLVKGKTSAILARSYPPAFAVRLMRKDLWLALVAGQDLGVPLPATAAAYEMAAAANATGKGDLDYSSVVALMEELAGIV